MKILLVAMLLATNSFAYITKGDASKLNRMGRTPSVTRLGTTLYNAQQFGAKGQYNFTTQGGAAGEQYSFLQEDGSPLELPDNAIVTDCFYEILTALSSATSSGAIKFSANSSGDLVSQSVAWSLSGINACDGPDDSTANMVKLTADRTIVASVGSESLTAGKVNLYIQYVLSD